MQLTLPEPSFTMMVPETVIHVGGPEHFIDLHAFVESVEVVGEVRWRQRVGEPPVIDHSRCRTAAVLVIQRGRKPGKNGAMEEIPPGTVWRTDCSWLHEVVEWAEPLAARLPENPDPPEPPGGWFIRPDGA